MTSLFIEAVIMAFFIGGIVGAAAALSLRASRVWGGQPRNERLEAQAVRIETAPPAPRRRR